jgi:hypothetical protein
LHETANLGTFFRRISVCHRNWRTILELPFSPKKEQVRSHNMPHRTRVFRCQLRTRQFVQEYPEPHGSQVLRGILPKYSEGIAAQ